MTTVLFRADSSIDIGSGHVMRCLALAHGLKKAGYSSVWAMRDYDGNLSGKVREDYPVELMPKDVTLDDDLKFTREIIGKYGAEVLITDAYHLTGEYLQAVKPHVKALFSIDDICGTHFYSDIVLNQNSNAEADFYIDKVELYTRLLLGPEFALLREEFAERRKSLRRENKKVKRLLITFGGADPSNQTFKALRAASAFELDITIVIGGGYSHRGELDSFVSGYNGKGEIALLRNVDNISELMAEADIAISAGGSTCWELACTGLPNMTLILADNQLPIAKDLEGRGVSINLGWYEDVTEDDIKTALSRLIDDAEKREAMSKSGLKLVDGRGVDRVVNIIDECLKGNL